MSRVEDFDRSVVDEIEIEIDKDMDEEELEQEEEEAYRSRASRGMVTVFMVAEKPSIAEQISHCLASSCHSRVSKRKSKLPIFEIEGSFVVPSSKKSCPALFRMTCVVGHVLKTDFPPEFQSWDSVNPIDLFSAPVVKEEATPKASVVRHLRSSAKRADYVVLWLDCDREGENICFEVIDAIRPSFGHGMDRIYRARFSALSVDEVSFALKHLARPNSFEALSVDARQELDLKMGVAFSRFQTRYFQGKYANLNSELISYGPCQTPTLGFCVDRHDLIESFVPEPFWVLSAELRFIHGGIRSVSSDRGRLFERRVALAYHSCCSACSYAKVVSMETKKAKRPRPLGMNTVTMLKLASSMLRMSPDETMSVAERLYIAGYLSYPRTESTSYPSSFDARKMLSNQVSHPLWGDYVHGLLSENLLCRPRAGHDAGDHPPITPVRACDDSLHGDALRLYELVSRNFIASFSPDCIYESTKMRLLIGSEFFTIRGSRILDPGFTAILQQQNVNDEIIPSELHVGDMIEVKSIFLREGKTEPPGYLSESELIGLMEKYGIGTDASISTHISSIKTRNYVRLDEQSRTLIPTTLGILLVHGYKKIDPELVLPTVRGHIEKEINSIACGQAMFGDVVEHALQNMCAKFDYFQSNISHMDELFETAFTTLSSAGQPLSQCGICHRTMKIIRSRPVRLFCPTCDTTYSLPTGITGSVRLFEERTCPLDGFQLVLMSGGSQGKTFPVCPYCYNNPPFEDFHGNMSCPQCLHPTCSFAKQQTRLGPCHECEKGSLIVESTAGSGGKLFCMMCSAILRFPDFVKRVSLFAEAECDECNRRYLRIDFLPGRSIAGDKGENTWTGCVFCDPLWDKFVEFRHARRKKNASSGNRRGGKGRGRGGRRGRGGGRGGDRGRGRGRGRGR